MVVLPQLQGLISFTFFRRSHVITINISLMHSQNRYYKIPNLEDRLFLNKKLLLVLKDTPHQHIKSFLKSTLSSIRKDKQTTCFLVSNVIQRGVLQYIVWTSINFFIWSSHPGTRTTELTLWWGQASSISRCPGTWILSGSKGETLLGCIHFLPRWRTSVKYIIYWPTSTSFYRHRNKRDIFCRGSHEG